MSQASGFLVLIFIIVAQQSNCQPSSPCASLFTYSYDRQWFGVVRLHPHIYNRLYANYIRLNVTLIVNQHIPPMQNIRLLDLMHSLPDTLRDKAAGKPIMYRVSFPFQDILPSLLHIHVNGKQICANREMMFGRSKIELQHTFYLPSIAYDENVSDYSDSYDFIVDDEESSDESNDRKVPPNPLQNSNLKQLQHSKDMDYSEDEVACGTQHEALKYSHLISGGVQISPGSWPWLVGIFHKKPATSNLEFLCTGSLVSNRMVVAAAHCFRNIETKEIVLAFGRHDLRDWSDKNMRLSNVEKVHIHPDYVKRRRSTAFDADIAVVVAKEAINFTAWIRPICLWPAIVDESMDIIGENGTVVGWGQPAENVLTNLPRRIDLPIVDVRRCMPDGRAGRKQRIFCAGNGSGGRAPCNGDSGSGLAMWVNGAWYLRGIVSAALGDPIINKCNLNRYVIFSDMVYYRDWLSTFLY